MISLANPTNSGWRQQQHDRAVHGEQLVVLRVRHDVVVRAEQLGPHDHGHQATDQEKAERSDQVQVADDLVVRGGQPAGQQRALAAGIPRRGLGLDGLLNGGHGLRTPC
jgi:hypothetical protein